MTNHVAVYGLAFMFVSLKMVSDALSRSRLAFTPLLKLVKVRCLTFAFLSAICWRLT